MEIGEILGAVNRERGYKWQSLVWHVKIDTFLAECCKEPTVCLVYFFLQKGAFVCCLPVQTYGDIESLG